MKLKDSIEKWINILGLIFLIIVIIWLLLPYMIAVLAVFSGF